MVYAIVGSRNFDDYEKVKEVLKDADISKIVSGGADGADSLGEKYAKEHDIELVTYLPDWKQYGKAAGMIRNKLIINDADVVIAFWDGVSKGTANSINLAKKQKKKLIVIYFGNGIKQMYVFDSIM
jgi:predicted Rossmann fold nucleotide-binding protein DprA/Smf involved in DNA uptake